MYAVTVVINFFFEDRESPGNESTQTFTVNAKNDFIQRIRDQIHFRQLFDQRKHKIKPIDIPAKTPAQQMKRRYMVETGYNVGEKDENKKLIQWSYDSNTTFKESLVMMNYTVRLEGLTDENPPGVNRAIFALHEAQVNQLEATRAAIMH